MINFKVKLVEDFQVLHVYFEGRLTPQDIAAIALPSNLVGNKGVVISGRLPLWAIAALTHQLVGCTWIATFDPNVGGGVVCISYSEWVKVGDIIRF